MKLPHSDKILQLFQENPKRQLSAADLREYLMVPKSAKGGFKKILDTLVRTGALELSQKKRYRYVETQRVASAKGGQPGKKVVRRLERPIDRSAGGLSSPERRSRSGKEELRKGERRSGATERKRPLSRWEKERQQRELEGNPVSFKELTALFLSRFGMRDHFSKEVLREVEQLPTAVYQELDRREDCRHLQTLCIDPIGARDHDDALSIISHNDGSWELWVHIADVSHYVQEGGAIDLEARSRAFTQYLPWQAVPMLPEELSTGLCSLVVGEDRLAFSCKMEISPEGDVTAFRFIKTVICVDADPHYEEAEKLADAGDPACSALRDLARLLRHRRSEVGVLELDMPESKVLFDENNEPVRIEQRMQIESMLWIEDCMLAANRCCALLLKERKLQGIYRVHPAPIPQDITELFRQQPDLFKETGFSPRALYEVELRDGPGSAVVPQLFDLFRKLVRNAGDDIEKKRMVLRAMQKARYSTEAMGHFALTWEDYAHFTAPIRRYTDLWCHRVMELSIEGRRRRYKGVEEMSETISEREIEVMKNERQGVKLCAVWMVRDRVGEQFAGRISGLSEWGMWVELLGTGAEGVVRYEAIRDDWYQYDPEKQRAVGRKSRRIFKRGDAMEVVLVRVNLERYELDLEPAPAAAEE